MNDEIRKLYDKISRELTDFENDRNLENSEVWLAEFYGLLCEVQRYWEYINADK